MRTSSLRVDDAKATPQGHIRVKDFSIRRRFALRFGDIRDDAGQTLLRSGVVRQAFNSPFGPFILASTSVGQEGLDFHPYCHVVYHWNLPSNPVDLEQREGRVHRYKGHAIRRNIAKAYGLEALAGDDWHDPWDRLFARAAADRPEGMSELMPYWLFETEGGWSVERRVPLLPLSREVAKLERLKGMLAIYRLAFGQPRQEDLVTYLAKMGVSGDSSDQAGVTDSVFPQTSRNPSTTNIMASLHLDLTTRIPAETQEMLDLNDRKNAMKTATTFPESLGFRSGAASAHTSRTMMSRNFSLVLNQVAANAPATAYRQAIIDDNALGKPTQTTRERSATRLTELYALDPDCSLFRLLRHFWSADPSSQPMLAFLLAAARDTLLREMTPLVVGIKLNEIVTANAIGEHLAQQYPNRFRPTTLHSTAQNLASSWTQAGYLRGKVKKSRMKSNVTPVVVSYAILLGYLCGLRGKLLLDSPGLVSWIVRQPKSPT